MVCQKIHSILASHSVKAPIRFVSILILATTSVVGVSATSILSPSSALPSIAGTGLPTSVWAVPASFHGTVASFDAAIVGKDPDATFLTNSINYALSTGLTLQNFVGSSGSDFTGTNLSIVERTYFILSGYIALTVNSANSVPFSLLSDDGSILFLNNITVINHDGLHSSTTAGGTAEFSQSGLYPIVIKYFNNAGNGQLKLMYDPTNSGTFINVPTSALYAGLPDIAVPEPEPRAIVFAGMALGALALAVRKRRILNRV